MSNNRRRRRRGRGALPDRRALFDCLSNSDRPLTLKEIAGALEIDVVHHAALARQLNAMVSLGRIACNRQGGFGTARKMDLVAGTVSAHSDGYGFLRLDEGGEDLFLPAREMRSVMHGDRLLARVAGTDRDGRSRGTLVEIIERAHKRVVGYFREENGAGFVVPGDTRLPDVVIPYPARACPGDYVVAEIVRQPEERLPPLGKVVEVLQGPTEHRRTMLVIIRSHELPDAWPKEVEGELAQISGEIGERELHGREDLRGLDLVTIDGENARDFDDAVYCERTDGGWRLIVAIADVSWYVRSATALDREALCRGTSVYFPCRVIPMLPERLSADLCSLRPDTARLCLACELGIDSDGEVRSRRLFPAVMRSAARLTYTETAALIEDRDTAARRRRAALLPRLECLYELYYCLHKRREHSGLLDFDVPEMRFAFDAEERVRSVDPIRRRDSHRLIEEMMLAANVAVAEFLLQHRQPGPYRAHASPEPERLRELRSFLERVGLSLGGRERPATSDYARLLERARRKNLLAAVQTMVLRSLPLAEYAADNAGHFGLGFAAYTHFTSPIRRYPDLLVHRAVRRLLKAPAGGRARSTRDVQRIAEQCSVTERRAENAEREMDRWCKCDYLRDRIGEEFEGQVSGVISSGLFVTLDGLGIDGLIHVSSLPGDYYHYDAEMQRLGGEHTGRVFGLAQRLRLRLLRVDMDNRRIDLGLVQAAEGGRR